MKAVDAGSHIVMGGGGDKQVVVQCCVWECQLSNSLYIYLPIELFIYMYIGVKISS